jgi:CheY-like chemotaxis protein
MPDRSLHILLVDDDEVDVRNVRRAIQRNQERGLAATTLHVAGDGVEALELLRAGAIPARRRLVLLDLNMPRMNGLELLRALRADPELAALPVVVLTTSDDERDKMEAYDLNVAGYLVKPVDFASTVELMAALETYWTVVELP